MATIFENSDLNSELISSLLEEKVKAGDDVISLGVALHKRSKLQLVTVVSWTTFASNTRNLSMEESFIALYVMGPRIQKVMINLSNFYKELESVIGRQVLDIALLKYNDDPIQ